MASIIKRKTKYSVVYNNLLKDQTTVRGSFSDKQFKGLLDESFLEQILASACCS